MITALGQVLYLHQPCQFVLLLATAITDEELDGGNQSSYILVNDLISVFIQSKCFRYWLNHSINALAIQLLCHHPIDAQLNLLNRYFLLPILSLLPSTQSPLSNCYPSTTVTRWSRLQLYFILSRSDNPTVVENTQAVRVSWYLALASNLCHHPIGAFAIHSISVIIKLILPCCHPNRCWPGKFWWRSNCSWSKGRHSLRTKNVWPGELSWPIKESQLLRVSFWPF